MIALVPFWIAPLAFVILALLLLARRSSTWRRASLYGLSGFGLFLVFGTYSILQIRSSTAGLGFIFLPIIALVPGLLGLALGKAHSVYLLAKQAHGPARLSRNNMVIWGALLLIPFVWQGYAVLETLSKNKERDIEGARQTRSIEDNTEKLIGLLSASPGKESGILSEMAAQTNDRTVLIPIAKNPFASAELLETLSHSTDYGVVLTVTGNKNTTGKTLEWVYRNHSYPPYFYMSLSGNANTPHAILHELYDKRAENGGIAWNLARNSNLPAAILAKLTLEQDKYVLRDVLNRPLLTCAQVSSVISTANTIEGNDLAWLTDMAKSRIANCIKDDEK